MTDKEIISQGYNSLAEDCSSKLDTPSASQIIIDGVDILGTIDDWADTISQEWNCDEYSTTKIIKSYILDINKQLQRKEQECEELKKYKDAINKLAGLQIILTNKDKMPELYENAKDLKIDSYKQALEKIEEIAEVSNNAPCLECECDCTQCEDETTDNGDTCMQYGLEKILNIINEVKDE